MDTDCFDRFTLAFADALTRRRVMATLGLGSLSIPILADAKQKRKKKNRSKIKRNAFGCVDVGKPCRGKDSKCCSGICRGKKPKRGEKDKSRCVGHDEGSCLAGQRQGLCGGEKDVPCTTSTGESGLCQTTTGNAAYCTAGGGCFACQRDADCEPFCGPGAACIRCTACDEDEGIPTACVGLIHLGCEFPA
jgi:hypothetical protein